jgi:lipopolysaccharide transport system permease protein
MTELADISPSHEQREAHSAPTDAPDRPRAAPPDVVDAPVPHVRIRPDTAWSMLDLRELWQFCDLLRSLAMRDVKLRYRQTALGIIWVLFQPLLAAGIFAVVFGVITKTPTFGVPHFVFAYGGMLMWNAFSGTLSKASTSLVGNAQLVSKVYFPRMILPLSTAMSTVIDFLISLALLFVLMPLFGVRSGVAIFTLPIWFALAVMLGLGLGLMAAALTVTYRDVQYIIPVLLPFLLYASPVGYTINVVPHNLRIWWHLNPMTAFLEASRWALFVKEGHPSVLAVCYSIVATIVIFLTGASVFVRMERKFADVI